MEPAGLSLRRYGAASGYCFGVAMMMKLVLIVLLAIAIGGLTAACQVNTPPPSATPTVTTAGQLADMGKTVFTTNCARCHGNQGQGITGPTLIGSGNTLDKYGTAQGLLNFIKSSMPLNAPGNLSQQDYLNVLGYLLVQNNYVSSASALNASNLGTINLK
jgi:mono/diheme cytochrome c family protein